MRILSCAKPGNICAHYYTHKHKTRKDKYVKAGNKIQRVRTIHRRRHNAPVNVFRNVPFNEADFNVAPDVPATRLRKRKGRRNRLRG